MTNPRRSVALTPMEVRHDVILDAARLADELGYESISVAEGWRRGPTARNDKMRWEPSQLTKVVPDLVAQAEPNSTMAS